MKRRSALKEKEQRMQNHPGSGYLAAAGIPKAKSQVWYAKQISVLGRSAKNAAFLSDFNVVRKNPACRET
jgi:hypothetical protein